MANVIKGSKGALPIIVWPGSKVRMGSRVSSSGGLVGSGSYCSWAGKAVSQPKQEASDRPTGCRVLDIRGASEGYTRKNPPAKASQDWV